MKYKIEFTATREEEESLRPFIGKYFLRDGDLHAEMLSIPTICKYCYRSTFLKRLNDIGLLFDTWEEAEWARNQLLSILKK